MKLKILELGILFLFLAIIFYFYERQVFSPHFVDEEDNFVLGKYIKNGEVLYKDLFSHHQPFSYVFSAGIQQITDPNSIYLLIKRHREVVMLWALLWWVILSIKIGWLIIPIALVYEVTKIYLLGHLFLSESFAVYPLIYLSTLSIQKAKSLWEYFIFGVSVSMILFLLSPLWPAVIFLGVIIFWKNIDRKKILFFVLGLSIIIAIIFPFISVWDYIFNAYYINFAYYIPATSRDGWLTNIIRSILSIITPLFSQINDSQILIVIKTLVICLLINVFVLFKSHKYKLLLITIISLSLANIRYVQPGLQYYSGFHILPWFGLLIFFSLYLAAKNSKILLTLTIIVLALEIFQAKNSLFIAKDRETDFYVNYSRQFDFGKAVEIMKLPNDRLFVAPDEWLIYWQGDIKHASKMVNYYAWMSSVPILNSQAEDVFRTNPPEFFYCDCTGHYFGLEKFWHLYDPIIKDGQVTKLLVLKKVVSRMSEQQRGNLRFYNFAI